MSDEHQPTDLDTALGGETQPETEAPETPVVAEQEPTPEEPTPEEPQAEQLPEKVADPVMVPLTALQETRDQLRDLKAQMKEMQVKPEPQKAPDMFADPEGYQKFQTSQFQAALQNERLNMSEALAVDKFGAEKVEAMVAAVKSDPALQAQWGQVANSANPYASMMKIYDQHRVAAEIGSDPEAYKAKIRDEIKAEIQAELAAEQVKKAAAQPAPSMANLTGTGGSPQTGFTGPTPLSKILGN